MRLLIKENKIDEQAKSPLYFGDKASSDFKLGFALGSRWTQRELQSMFLLFVRWCMDRYYTMSEADIWIPSDYGLSKDSVNWKTTEELFELWLEEQTKKQ